MSRFRLLAALSPALLLLGAPSAVLAQAPAPAAASTPSRAADAARLARIAASPFEFSIANIMRGPEVYGREPSQIRWTPDSRWIYFRWVEPGADWRDTLRPYRVRPVAGAQPEAVSAAHMDSIAPLLAAGAMSRDRRRRVVSHDGDLYLVDLARQSTRRLTAVLTPDRSPTFSADDRTVYFVRDDNVFALELDGGLLRQLTDVRRGEAPARERPPTGQRGFLEQQQLELLETIRDEARRDSVRRAGEARRDSLRVAPLYLARTERVTSLEVSPAGNALLIATTTPAQNARQTIVPNYVTRSGYTEDLNVRTKVGDAQNTGRVAFMRLPSGQVQWLKPIPDDSTAAPSFVQIVGWNASGDAALISVLAADFKTRYLHQVNADGSMATLEVMRDTAWVAGPCFSCAGWIGDRAYYVSEADGFAHLYTVARGGGDKRQLTSGRWEVLAVELTDDQRHFMLRTNEGTPFQQHVYRMPVNGGERVRLTSEVGSHDATLSPDGRMLAVVHSRSDRPPELFVMANQPGARMAQLTTSPTAEWLSHPWVKPEIVHIPASDGVQVPARIYRPEEWGATPNGAAVMFVHGAGYLQNVHDWWSSYAREYMFNQLLASKGYVVLDVDYRASSGYGRDWRTAIYRHMGGRDLQDFVDASRWLQREFSIEPERVGIYGGSYGGFITMMALFTEAQDFGAGAALRSVTDWAHYNHGYTGRILNTPQTDSIAFRRSSPIYFAEGLQDPLLILHGMLDVNVHFQDVVRLTQRLIELGKTDWELAVYPVEDHAFVRPSSWTDEYRRIWELFERHLPRGAPGSSTAGAAGSEAPQ